MLLLEDLLIATRTVYGEARGESFLGKKAVAHVLINRVDVKKFDPDQSLASASLRWLQFSAWNEQDPNRDRLLKVSVDDKMFRECLRAVLEAIDEPDFTSNATHYHSVDVMPRWAAGQQPCYTEGRHVFYKNIL